MGTIHIGAKLTLQELHKFLVPSTTSSGGTISADPIFDTFTINDKIKSNLVVAKNTILNADLSVSGNSIFMMMQHLWKQLDVQI